MQGKPPHTGKATSTYHYSMHAQGVPALICHVQVPGAEGLHYGAAGRLERGVPGWQGRQQEGCKGLCCVTVALACMQCRLELHQHPSPFHPHAHAHGQPMQTK